MQSNLNVIQVNFDTQNSPEYSKNSMADDVWEIFDTSREKMKTIDFNSKCEGLPDEWKILMKQLTDNWVERNEKGELFVSAFHTVEIKSSTLTTFFKNVTVRYPNKAINNLNWEEIADCFIRGSEGKPQKLATIKNRNGRWQELFDLHDYGLGEFTINELPNSRQFQKFGERAYVQEVGTKEEYYSKGSFAGAPMPVVIPLLSHCLEILDNDETKYLLAQYEYLRRIPEHERTRRNLFLHNNKIGQHHFPTNFMVSKSGKEMAECVLKRYPDLSSIEELPYQTWPFTEGRESDPRSQMAHNKRVLVAAIIATMILTGIRKSEIAFMPADALKRKDDGTYEFTSDIFKTNSGIPTVRYIAGYSATIVDVLDELGMQSLSEREYLFSYVHMSQNITYKTFTATADTFMKRNIDWFYEEFKAAHDESISELAENITAHMFRHSFAEFALRRFDGDVMEHIRRHFRHWSGSYMTFEYVKAKQHEDEWQENVNQYLIEKIQQFVDGSADLLGSMGKTIKRMVSESTLLSPREVAEEVQGKLGNVTLKAHEYGFCVLVDATQDQAMCYDKQLKMANTEDATIHQCSRCIHRLTLQSQTETIKRLGWSFKQRAKLYELEGELSGVFAKEMKVAKALLADIAND